MTEPKAKYAVGAVVMAARFKPEDRDYHEEAVVVHRFFSRGRGWVYDVEHFDGHLSPNWEEIGLRPQDGGTADTSDSKSDGG